MRDERGGKNAVILHFIGIFWTVWRGAGSVYVTEKLVAGRDFGAMESRPLSDRKQGDKERELGAAEL